MSGSVTLSGFLKWETPSGDVRLCDGGTLVFGGERYTTKHPVFGVVAGFDSLVEGVGDEVPAGSLTFAPHPDAAPEVINSPDLQGTRIRMWIGEIDADTGLIVGTPELVADNVVDVTSLKLARGQRLLNVEITSRVQRFFLTLEGNVLSGEFHRRIYPDETGLDNALGVPQVVAWGVAGPQRGAG